jgi:hypothetical protein
MTDVHVLMLGPLADCVCVFEYCDPLVHAAERRAGKLTTHVYERTPSLRCPSVRRPSSVLRVVLLRGGQVRRLCIFYLFCVCVCVCVCVCGVWVVVWPFASLA